MGVFADTRGYVGECWQAWNRFWFRPTDPATLSLIRLFAGTMLFYTHLVWSLDLQAFLGQEGWLPVEFIRRIQGEQWSVWSVFFWIKPVWLLWLVHILALLVFFCLMLGLFSRTMAVLGFLFAASYAHRVSPGAFFGLDKVNCMLVMYLMLGPSGARYSLDSVRRHRRGDTQSVAPSTAANLPIRLHTDPSVHHLSLLRAGKAHGRELAGGDSRLVGVSESGVSVDRHDLAGDPSRADRASDAFHNLLGTVLLCAGVEPVYPAAGAVDGSVCSRWDCAVHGDDHVRAGDVDRQLVVCQTGDGAALGGSDSGTRGADARWCVGQRGVGILPANSISQTGSLRHG